MVLIAAFAFLLMALVGAAVELLELDMILKANTMKKRTLSVLRQGFYWNERIGSMKEEHYLPMITRFVDRVQEHAVFRQVPGRVSKFMVTLLRRMSP